MPLPVLLAVMLSWVAFGPGTRQFAIVAGDGATAVAMSGGHEISGRLAFGFGAVLAWFIAAYMFMVMLRRTFPRR